MREDEADIDVTPRLMRAVIADPAALLGGQIADRWMPAERFLIISHVLAAAILWVMAGLTTVSAMLLAMLAFALVFTPSLAISAATERAAIR